MKLKPEIFPDAQRCAAYRAAGHWGDATLLDYWNMAVLAQPEKTAVVDNSGLRFTYAALDAQAERLALWMQRAGLEPGDVVSIQLPGWAEFTLIYIACLKTGAVVNPIIAAYRGHELSHIIASCQPKLIFMPMEFRRFSYISLGKMLEETMPGNPRVVYVNRGVDAAGLLSLSRVLDEVPGKVAVPKPDVNADDVAALLFTSGTEKSPKGVLLTHNNIISSIRAFAARLNLNSRDTIFMPSPLGHATGFHHGVTTPFILGGTSVLQDTFNAEEALNIMEHEGCTYGMGAAPFVYDLSCAMSKVPYNLSALRFFLCGGAPSPRHLLESLWEKGFRVINVYGSTESVPHTVTSPLLGKSFLSEGTPVDGCEVRVVNAQRRPVPPGVEGEEASRGPNVFVGYLNEPQLTAAAVDAEGWYYSGDLCVMDEQGAIRIIGRKKDIIVRGGENISSREVEEALLMHEAVAEAAVVGMPDPRLGERVCAFVVARAPLTFAEMKEHFARLCLAKCKFPERLELVAEIPKNPVGKVRKEELRQRIAAALCQENAGTGDRTTSSRNG